MHQPDRYCIAIIIIIIIIIEINNYMVLAHQFNARYSILDTTYPTPPFMCEEGLQHKRLHKSQSHTNILIWAFAQSALAVEWAILLIWTSVPSGQLTKLRPKQAGCIGSGHPSVGLWFDIVGKVLTFMLLCVWYYHSVTCGAILSDCDNQCTSWLKRHKACQQKSICVPLPNRHNLFQNCIVPICHTPHIFASSRCRRKNQFVGLTFWLSSAYILSSTEAATWGGPNEFEAAIPKPSSQKICPQAAFRGNSHTFFVIVQRQPPKVGMK